MVSSESYKRAERTKLCQKLCLHLCGLFFSIQQMQQKAALPRNLKT